MKLHRLLTAAAVTLSLAAGSAFAQDEKAKKQAEIRKATATSLQKFYKADPKLKEAVAKAPGYAVFTTYGLSFIFGGAGGKGLVHDSKTKKVTYMDMAQASAGLQIGASESETLIVFKSPKAMQNFIDSGWEAGGGGAVQAGAAGKSVGAAGGENVIADASYYTLTKNGLQAGVAVAGTKYWKDKELN
jgi:lipid-binding SYLF domain-containing protein